MEEIVISKNIYPQNMKEAKHSEKLIRYGKTL
jgi:hypothetical protein